MGIISAEFRLPGNIGKGAETAAQKARGFFNKMISGPVAKRVGQDFQTLAHTAPAERLAADLTNVKTGIENAADYITGKFDISDFEMPRPYKPGFSEEFPAITATLPPGSTKRMFGEIEEMKYDVMIDPGNPIIARWLWSTFRPVNQPKPDDQTLRQRAKTIIEAYRIKKLYHN
jgi:hypothetical protein